MRPHRLFSFVIVIIAIATDILDASEDAEIEVVVRGLQKTVEAYRKIRRYKAHVTGVVKRLGDSSHNSDIDEVVWADLESGQVRIDSRSVGGATSVLCLGCPESDLQILHSDRKMPDGGVVGITIGDRDRQRYWPEWRLLGLVPRNF